MSLVEVFCSPSKGEGEEGGTSPRQRDLNSGTKAFSLGLPQSETETPAYRADKGKPIEWKAGKWGMFPLRRVQHKVATVAQKWQFDYIDWAIASRSLVFRDTPQPSGKVVPFNYNLDGITTGGHHTQLASFYARAVREINARIDVVWAVQDRGDLAVATAIQLAALENMDVKFSLTKDRSAHRMQQAVEGAPLNGNVLLLGDIMQGGTLLRDHLKFAAHLGAKVVGVLVAIDTQELSPSGVTFLRELESSFSIPVHSICTVRNIYQRVSELAESQPAMKGVEERLSVFRGKYCLYEEEETKTQHKEAASEMLAITE